MSYIVSNHDFTHGELDKTLFARSNLAYYTKAAAIVKNAVIYPGGAARSRFGTVSSGIDLPPGSNFQLFPWTTGEYNYLIIIGDVSGSGSNSIKVIELESETETSFDNNFSVEDVQKKRIRYAQQQDEIILVSGSAQPYQLTSNPSDGSVSGAPFVFKNPPTYDYNNDYDSATFTLSSTSITPPSTPNNQCPTMTASGFTFSSDFVGGEFKALGPSTGTQIGTGRIVQYDSTSQVRIRITSAFGSTSNLGSECLLTESAYNSNRGFPVDATFYEDRLCFAGGKGVPQTFFLSAIADFRDFSTGLGLASDGISYTIASGSADKIINVMSARSLQIFTENGENASPVWGTEGLTPDTVAVRRQTSNGSSGVRPIILDDATLFVKRGGRAVMAFVYGVAAQSYSALDMSVMSSHLIRNPISMSSYTVNDAYDSNMLLLINSEKSDGGSLATYQTLQEQNVSAWTSTSTYEGKSTDISSFDDYWNNVCVVQDEVFFIATRGSSSTKYLEKMDWKICMDGAVSQTLNSTGMQDINLPNASHLHGRSVQVITDLGDDNSRPEATYLGTYQMDANGTVRVDIPKTGEYWFGLEFDFVIKTMPAHIMTQNGDTLYTKKRISKIYVQYINSYSFELNGNQVPVDNLSVDGDSSSTGIVLDQASEPKDGIYTMPSMFRGWNRSSYAEVTQKYPLPVTILGISVVLTA